MLVVMPLLWLGCEKSTPPKPANDANSQTKVPARPTAVNRASNSSIEVKVPANDNEPPTPLAKKIGKNVYFELNPENGQRRVFVSATVCLREGDFGLECLMCRKGTKEHESILSTDSDARVIHFGLEAANAKAGAPVQFEPKFQSPTGTPIKITLLYRHHGKIVTRPAEQWIQNVKTKKALDEQWVFAGSQLYKDPENPTMEPIYLATAEGAYISVANVPTAMLDLPINSPKHLDERGFSPFTERIPALETKVLVILEPILKNKKD